MQKSDKIFITGGTGLLGRFLILELLKEGYSNIHAIYRAEKSIQDLPTPIQTIHWHLCDLLDPLGLKDVMEGSEWVFHCAAKVSFDPRDAKTLMSTNMQGTQLVAETARILDVRRFCHVSSVAALGRSKKAKPIAEENEWSSENASWYAKSKYAAEQEIWRSYHEGLDVVIVNPSIILGPGRWQAGSSKIFWQVWKGLRFYTTGSNGFVDVRDVARFMILAMQRTETSGQRYILCGENTTYKNLFSRIAILLNKKPPSIAVNGLIKALSWRIEYIRSLFTNSRPLITKETAHTSTLNILYDNSKSLQLSDFNYRPLEETLQFNTKSMMEDISKR